MTSDGTHTLHRIDVKDRLPKEGSSILCWGHQVRCGWRWVDVLTFEAGRFIDQNIREADCDEDWDFTHMVTHWASLVPLNWNDGLPLHRSYIQ